MKFTDVPIPHLMQTLERDHRGYPIPFLVFRDTDNKPHFTINDEHTRQLCLINDQCAICGRTLFAARWLIGGPKSAFDPMGAYIDTPLHGDCMHYALQVCPYLWIKNYRGRIDAGTLDPAKIPEGVIGFQDNTMDPERPPLFVGVQFRKADYTHHPGGGVQYVKPRGPYRNVEYWSGGVQLSTAQGEMICRAAGIEPNKGFSRAGSN